MPALPGVGLPGPPVLLVGSGLRRGPHFVRPEPPAATQYTQGQEPAQTVTAAGQAQRFDHGAKIAAEWWRLFQSPQLDTVIKEVVAENLNLKSAERACAKARKTCGRGTASFSRR